MYLANATGAIVHIHYCMGKLMSISFTNKVEDKCGGCGMKKSEEKKGCCKDEHKTFKSAEHKSAISAFDFLPQQYTHANLPPYSFYHVSVYPICLSNIISIPFSFWRMRRIYLEFQNFRI